jgi:hypothetical protein
MNDDWFDFCDGVSDRLYRYASIEDLQKKAVSMEKFAITALASLQKNLPAETYDEVMRKNPDVLPKQEVKEDKKTKALNTSVLPVYDLEVKAWRSFKIASIKKVSFEE